MAQTRRAAQTGTCTTIGTCSLQRDVDTAAPPRDSMTDSASWILYSAAYAAMTAQVIQAMGLGLTMPVLPYFVDAALHGRAVDVGTIISYMAVMALLTKPVWAYVSDKTSERFVVIENTLAAAVGFTGSGFATRVWHVLLFRSTIHGALGFAAGASVSAYIVKLFPGTANTAKRAEMLSLRSFILGLSNSVIPAIGAGLSLVNLRLPFFVGGATAATATMVCICYMHPADEVKRRVEQAAARAAAAVGSAAGGGGSLDPKASSAEQGTTTKAADCVQRETTRWVPVTLICLAVVLNAAGNIPVTMVIMPLYLSEHLGWGQAQFAFLFIAQGVCQSWQACFYPPLQARLSSFGVQALAGALLASAHAIFALAPLVSDSHAGVQFVQGPVAEWTSSHFGIDVWHTLLVGLVVTATLIRAVGNSLTLTTLNNSLAHLAGASVVARVMALGGMALDFTRIVFPPLMGFIYEYGHELPFVFSAVNALGGLLFAIFAKMIDDKLETIEQAQPQAPAALM